MNSVHTFSPLRFHAAVMAAACTFAACAAAETRVSDECASAEPCFSTIKFAFPTKDAALGVRTTIQIDDGYRNQQVPIEWGTFTGTYLLRPGNLKVRLQFWDEHLTVIGGGTIPITIHPLRQYSVDFEQGAGPRPECFCCTGSFALPLPRALASAAGDSLIAVWSAQPFGPRMPCL
jgi:hypothetical protein